MKQSYKVNREYKLEIFIIVSCNLIYIYSSQTPTKIRVLLKSLNSLHLDSHKEPSTSLKRCLVLQQFLK